MKHKFNIVWKFEEFMKKNSINWENLKPVLIYFGLKYFKKLNDAILFYLLIYEFLLMVENSDVLYLGEC